jgi:hypothetical protein
MVLVRAALLATARQAMPVGVTSTGRVVAYPRTDARQFGHLALTREQRPCHAGVG